MMQEVTASNLIDNETLEVTVSNLIDNKAFEVTASINDKVILFTIRNSSNLAT